MLCYLNEVPKSVLLMCFFGVIMINGFWSFNLELDSPEESQTGQDFSREDQSEKSGQGPPLEYEKLRRRIYSNTEDFWFYLRNELHVLKKQAETDKMKERIQAIIYQTADRKRSLLSDQEMLPRVDGYDNWRRQEAIEVSNLVQRRLRHIQNPTDCQATKKILCPLNVSTDCGFGCAFHTLVYCLVFGYTTQRTVVLNASVWGHEESHWHMFFKPLSDTCTTTYDEEPVSWIDDFETCKVMLVTKEDVVDEDVIHDPSRPRPLFLPLAVPQDIGMRIARFNGDPGAWWLGQLAKYAMRMHADTQRDVASLVRTIRYQSPTVGVHVRRSDKVWFNEADYHFLEEYMEQVEDYFATLDLINPVPVVRRVYLATDNTAALRKSRAKYPNYTFVSTKRQPLYGTTKKRYSKTDLIVLLADLVMLATSDYLVGTFSSNIGRLAYELMHGNRSDACTAAHSLDYQFHFRAGKHTIVSNRLAVIGHGNDTEHEISFEIGDEIEIPATGNLFNGYGIGLNKRKNKTGLFPWYKTSALMATYPFPRYKHV